MAVISQKTQYALRAVFELAKRQGDGAVKIGSVAAVQAIPKRFLENILLQLRGAGIVESRRGRDGGYLLIRDAANLTVGEIIRLVQGPLDVVDCVSSREPNRCPLGPECLFLPLWIAAGQAQMEVFNRTTFKDLLNKDRQKEDAFVPTYSI
jgi:Rrf2 family transcriptional regulator, cysteine metabolism repressor